MADISKYTAFDGTTYNLKDPIARSCIAFGQVDSTSTATAFTAQVEGVTEYFDGLTIVLKNGVVTSASGFTLNVNGLGAKQSYTNLAAATADTTLFNINYTMMFIYDSTRVSGGGWICYRGYDANTNTIGYQLRTNSSTLPASQKFYRYRLLFTSADGTHWVPSNTSSSTNATASRTVNQTPIDPFGEIVYYGTTTAIEANANVTATQLWQEYTLTLGYSFNRTGAALVLPYPKSIYLKCTPQADGSAIMDADNPYVTALPSTKDGKIYIYLGRTYSATQIELTMNHPVYYCDGTSIKPWIGIDLGKKVDVEKNVTIDSANYASVIDNDGDGVRITSYKLDGTPSGSTTLAVEYDGIVLHDDGGNPVRIENVKTPTTATDAANKGYVDSAIPTKTSDLTNDSGFLTSAVTTFNGQSGAVTYTAPVTSVNGQTGDVTVAADPVVIEGTLTFTLSSTSGSGTFTPTSGDVTKIPTADEVYIKADIHGFSMLSSDYVWLRKMRKASTGMGIVMFNGVFDTAAGTVYVEVEGEPDDEYDWHYATWSVTYRILQQKLTFDSTPTENSTNPVTSGGVYAAIQGGTSSGLIVTVEGHNTNDGYVYTKDKTFAEISAVILANEPCVLVLKDYNAQSYPIRTEVYSASHISSLTGNPTQIWFTKVYTSGDRSVQASRIVIKSTEAVEFSSNYLLITDVYSSTSTNAMSGVAVASAISGFITTETDPTVPAWAKESTKPTYTASEVGALPSNTTYVSSVNGSSGAVTLSIPTKTTARADSNVLYNGQSVDTTIDNVGISTTNNLLNTTGHYVALRANSTNPFLGLKEGSNLWYAQAASNYFYFGPTSTKALRLDQNGNGVFQTGSVTATSIIKSGGTSSQFLKADGSVDSSTYLTASTGVTSVNGSHGAVTGLQTTGNLVTSVSSSSTDSQYPSAKLFYDTVGNIETLLAAI